MKSTGWKGSHKGNMENSIHNIDTKWFENESGEFPAIVMGLNLYNTDDIESFLDFAIEQFKNQRMCSPPDTQNMTISIAGDTTAKDFNLNP